MIGERYPTLFDRLRRIELTLSIPCRHGWQDPHCDRDDEGSHVSEGGDGISRFHDGDNVLRDTDFCYCEEAVHLDLRLESIILADRILRFGRRAVDRVIDGADRLRETRQT